MSLLPCTVSDASNDAQSYATRSSALAANLKTIGEKSTAHKVTTDRFLAALQTLNEKVIASYTFFMASAPLSLISCSALQDLRDAWTKKLTELEGLAVLADKDPAAATKEADRLNTSVWTQLLKWGLILGGIYVGVRYVWPEVKSLLGGRGRLAHANHGDYLNPSETPRYAGGKRRL